MALLVVTLPIVSTNPSKSSLVQVMACRLFSDKPLPAPKMTYFIVNTLGDETAQLLSQNIGLT